MQPISGVTESCSPLINQIAERFGKRDLLLIEEELRSTIPLTSIVYAADDVPLKSKFWQIVEQIVTIAIGIIIFPIGIYWLFKAFAESKLMPVVNRKQFTYERVHEFCSKARLDPRTSDNVDHIQRMSVAVEGHLIDAYVVSPNVETLKNRTWTLVAGGNNGSAEYNALKACCGGIDSFQRNFARPLNSNLLFFEYPGVMASEGPLSMEMIGKVYRAMLKLVSDKENGFGAKELFLLNTSMGGGASARGRVGYVYPKDIKHVVVNVVTYHSLVAAVTALAGSVMGRLAHWWDWTSDVARESKRLTEEGIPEIIVYSNADKVVLPEASLAHAMKELHDPDKKAVLFLERGVHISSSGNPHTVLPFKESFGRITELARHYAGGSAEDPRQLISHFSVS